MPQNEATTGPELEERLDLIRGLFTQGLSQRDVVKYCRDKHADWGVTDRQIRNYCYSVMKSLADDAPGIDRAAYFVRTVERLDYLYTRAVQLTDFKTALAVTQQLIKLLRLDMPNADFDWKKAAEQAGLSPSDLFEKVVQAVAAAQEQEADANPRRVNETAV